MAAATRGGSATRARRFLDVRAGDVVVVIAGKDKGKRGVVDRTLPGQSKVVVKGVNMHKRHTRAGSTRTRSGSTGGVIQGGIIDFESPLSSSNVMLVCPSCDRPTRVRHSTLPDGNHGRVCAHCGEVNEQVAK